MQAILHGNDLQFHASKAVEELVPEILPQAIREAVTSVTSEVEDHGRCLVTIANIGMSYRSVGPDQITDRTPGGMQSMVRRHLEELIHLFRI